MMTTQDLTALGHDSPMTAVERRAEPRYRSTTGKTFLGWWEAETFRAELGTLRDVSAGGAAVEITAGLPSTDEVWLCITGPGRVHWAAARVVGRGTQVAHLAFAEPLSHELFALLI
jgi:hypothetical protein